MKMNELLHVLKEETLNDISPNEERLPAAVLVIIHYKDEPYVILTKRSDKLKNHAGEVSFPGGRPDDSDIDLKHTAIREAEEEIGISISESEIIGMLNRVDTLTSNFSIIPFVALTDRVSSMRINATEIESIIDAPLLQLLRSIKYERSMEQHIFEFKGHIIWGATARILKQIYDILERHGVL